MQSPGELRTKRLVVCERSIARARITSPALRQATQEAEHRLRCAADVAVVESTDLG